MTRRSCSSCWSPCPRQYTRSPNICDGRSACYGRRSEDEVTRRMSAILGEYSPAGQGCTRHFSVPPLEYKNSTSYKKYRPNFGLNIQESYGKRPIAVLRTHHDDWRGDKYLARFLSDLAKLREIYYRNIVRQFPLFPFFPSLFSPFLFPFFSPFFPIFFLY